MVPEPTKTDIVDNLRWLAASDPKQARVAFQTILAGDKHILDEVLTLASKPGDGRLRQMVATTYRTNPGTSVLEDWLRRWLEVEPDEFTKTAIEAALSAQTSPTPRPASRSPVVQTLEAYRYVSDRLCHRIRNAITLPSAQTKRLEQLLTEVADPAIRTELTEILAGIQTGLVRISRNVEFDTGDEYMTWQPLPLIGWLESATSDFSARFGAAQLSIVCDPAVRRARVRATRFFLETIFGNLWSNAIQAVDPTPCHFRIQCALDSSRGIIAMIIADNGPGFSETHLETAFHQVFSTKSDSRGRGLLEVADAVLRLQGTVDLVKTETNEYRLRITLPVEAS